MQALLSSLRRRVALACLGALLGMLLAGCGAQRGVPVSGSGAGPVGETLTMTRCSGAAQAPTISSNSPNSPLIYASALGAESNAMTTSDLYALAPSNGARLWCDQFALMTGFTCSLGEHCPPPPLPDLGAPLVAGGALYVCVAAAGGYTYALNASDGALRWRSETGCMLGADPNDTAPPPALADGLLYSGADALDAATGAVRWRLPADAEPGVVADGVLYGFDQGDVFAWNAQTDQQLWSYSLPDPIGGGPSVANGVVYVGDIGGDSPPDTFALDAQTGKLLWRAPTGVASSAPLVVGDVVYVGGRGPAIFAVAASDGRILWRDDTSPATPSTAVVGGGVVFFTAYGVYAVDAASGRILWRQALGANLSTGFTTPALAGGALYFAKTDGSGGATLYALSASDGAILWSRGGFDQLSAPVVAADLTP